MRRRIFLGIELDKKSKEILYNYYSKKLKELNITDGITPKENLHITLYFFGETEENKIKKLVNELQKINFKSFTLTIKYTSIFENKSGNVYFFKIYSKELYQLYNKIVKILNLKKDRYIPHITFLRTKNKININFEKSILTQTNKFTLFETVITNKVIFKPTKRFYLK